MLSKDDPRAYYLEVEIIRLMRRFSPIVKREQTSHRLQGVARPETSQRLPDAIEHDLSMCQIALRDYRRLTG